MPKEEFIGQFDDAEFLLKVKRFIIPYKVEISSLLSLIGFYLFIGYNIVGMLRKKKKKENW